MKGKCSVEINSKIKKYLSIGDSFGDLGIAYNSVRSASIYSL